MEIIKVRPAMQLWLYPKDVAKLIGRKVTATSEFLREFREFCEKRPNYFNPVKPIQQDVDRDKQYNYFALLHFYENRELLMAGTRSLKFKDDLPRLKEAYYI